MGRYHRDSGWPDQSVYLHLQPPAPAGVQGRLPRLGEVCRRRGMKAIICNKSHPDLGCATIPLPIPDE